MTLPEFYRKTAEGNLMSFNFSEIASGTGTETFLGFVTVVSGAETNHLSASALNTAKVELSGAISVNNFLTFEKEIDHDFDLTEFVKSGVKIKGTGYIRFSWNFHNTSAQTGAAYMVAKLRFVRAGVETDIATAQTEYQTQTTGTGTTNTVMMPFPIEKTSFKKGDILRLTMEGWVNTNGNPGAVTGFIVFGTDPQNKDGVTLIPSGDGTGHLTTNLKVWVPFLIPT